MQRSGDGVRAVIFTADDDPASFCAFSRFRHFYFVERLGWQLDVKEGLETDAFDSDAAIYCIVLDQGQIIGGWRALPTEAPYLAQTAFPQLATLGTYPRRPDVWEMTRLGATRHQALIYGLMFRFALQKRAHSLVAVVDTAHERLLRRHGIRTRRYGAPQHIGVTTRGRAIEAIAGEIPLADQDPRVIDRFLAGTRLAEISDETLVLRSAGISA